MEHEKVDYSCLHMIRVTVCIQVCLVVSLAQPLLYRNQSKACKCCIILSIHQDSARQRLHVPKKNLNSLILVTTRIHVYACECENSLIVRSVKCIFLVIKEEFMEIIRLICES